MPGRAYAHGSLVVTTEDIGEVVPTTLVKILGIDAHVLQVNKRNHIIGGTYRMVSTRQFPRRAGIVDTDVGSTCNRCIVTTSIGITEGSTVKIDIGSIHIGLVNAPDNIILTQLHIPFRGIHLIDGIVIVAISTAKELTNEDMLVATFPFRSGQDKGADIFQTPMVFVTASACALTVMIASINSWIGFLNRRSGIDSSYGTDGSRDVVTTIDRIDDDVASHILTVNIDIGTSGHISLTGTAKDTAA